MSPRVEAIEASEFAIAFASYIEGDMGLLIVLVVMAGPWSSESRRRNMEEHQHGSDPGVYDWRLEAFGGGLRVMVRAGD